MTACETIRGRLEAYLDGELPAGDAAAVTEHVKSCAVCGGELAELRKLEALLTASSKGAKPDTGRYIAAVRRRVARDSGRSWRLVGVGALAAALLVALGLWLQAGKAAQSGPDHLRMALAAAIDSAHTRGPGAIAALAAQLHADDPAVIEALKQLVHDGTPRQKQSAAVVLAMHASEDVRRWLIESGGEKPSEDVEILEIGVEPTDDELIGAAFELARSPRTRDDAVHVLRKLHRGGLNRRAVDGITLRIREMLGSGEADRAVALEVLLGAGLRFPMSDVVELLDAPVLGEKAHEFLKGRTGRDFGRDKAKWREFVASQT